MALEVIMPKAGVDMTEGQIVQWNKKVGEFVKEGEILLDKSKKKLDNFFFDIYLHNLKYVKS